MSDFVGWDTFFFLLVIIAGAVAYILKEAQEKEELKTTLKAVLADRQGGPVKSNSMPEGELNQVYLKEKSNMDNPRQLAGNSIYKIVITGGPCGGKSTSLSRIQKELT